MTPDFATTIEARDAVLRLRPAGPLEPVPVGWGKVRAWAGDGLVCLPHLSRFAIFGRPQCATALDLLFPEGTP